LGARREIACLGVGTHKFVQDRLDSPEIESAYFGERYAASRAREQPDAQSLLELAHPARDDRGITSDPRGGSGEASGLAYGHEGRQLLQRSLFQQFLLRVHESNAAVPDYRDCLHVLHGEHRNVERKYAMKTLLSIGAGPGMGFATAERFAKEGFQVVLAARNAAKTQELAEKLRSKGYKAEARKVDSSDPKSVADLVAEVEKQHGTIDVLHYNAASMRKATLAEQPSDTFNGDLAVNIGGALVAVQAAAPRMEQRKSGPILLTGGGFALAPSPDYLSLSIGKAGIRALALGLFEPFREKGIYVRQ
jgi:NADP-dependent 3-hydroxy acid dehydrogenase YdfG